MSDQGFYRRRRGIYEHLEIGDIDLLDLGLHDWLCGHARALMNSGKYPAGVWIGNAEVIYEKTGKQTFHKVCKIRRRLAKLEKLKYIRRFKINSTTTAYVVNRMIGVQFR